MFPTCPRSAFTLERVSVFDSAAPDPAHLTRSRRRSPSPPRCAGRPVSSPVYGHRPRRRTDRRGAGDPHVARGSGAGGYRGRNQTSDGKPGIVVGPPVDGPRAGSAVTINDFSYEIAPGVMLREWDQVDGRQPIGQVRMNLLSISLDAPNITLRGAVPEVRHQPQDGQPARPLEQRPRRGQRRLLRHQRDRGAARRRDQPRARASSAARREGWIPGVNSSLWFDDDRSAHQPAVRAVHDPPAPRLDRQRHQPPRASRAARSASSPTTGAARRATTCSPAARAARARSCCARTGWSPTGPSSPSGRKIRKKDRVLIGVGPGRRRSSSSSRPARRSPCPSGSRAASRRWRSAATARCWPTGVRTVVNNTHRPPAYGGRHRRRRPQAADPRRRRPLRRPAAATPWSSSPT